MAVQILRNNENVTQEVFDALKKISNRIKSTDYPPEFQRRIYMMYIRKGRSDIFSHSMFQIEIKCSECVANELLRKNIEISQREYNFGGDLNFVCCKEITQNEEAQKMFESLIYKAVEVHKHFTHLFGDRYEPRHILPASVMTNLVITVSVLSLLKIIQLERYSRTSDELKEICSEIYSIFNSLYPEIFNRTVISMKL